MNIEDIKKEVSDLKPLTVKFKKHIVAALENLYPGVDTKEAACLLYLGLDSQPSCRVCGQKTPFYPLSKAVIKAHIGGWNDVCSHKCSTIKNKETSLKKYGVEHHLKSGSSSDALEKQKMTNRTRYGVEHVLQNKDINQKMQDRIRVHRQKFDVSEIDIFFPEHKVGVEVNGVYYHSEYRGGKDSKYHLNKTIDCVSKGIKLFHFTDVQLDTKKDIIISMIKHAIGKTENKIYARKTRIVQLQKGQFEWFFEENHIDGNATAKFAIGLYHGDDLVMCMSMGHPRNGHDKRYEFEIIRLATKLNTHVVGGFQKIWNYLIKEHSPSSIMSYQDRRYGGMMSSAYSSVMKLERITDPSWEGINIKSGEVRHRLWFTSNRLKEKFPETYDETKTVKQNMIDHGYDRIWNCGQYVWVWTS